ncbi:amidohydrolase family protein [Akkermansiaceae bacterium]|jgi:imidazolonepropionase-like amidohydrolase|nr:amidohydrolase family protein [Akkermansiaceae bacterium]MDA7934232.1 amidohydrolase family protein [Akkermansiaceae bacterium]MDA9830092.1 amidohydrolase family protein [Akkermansiaceae bacterium]MDB4464810.1 amidohydrolase family protein [Akkermansiaceae bacterium]MDF1710830.1 amidohydrolase family protein [Akkermansiaceae bacterium]
MFKAILVLALTAISHGQIAVKADLLFTMTGDLKPIKDGVVLCGKNGKIRAVGPASQIKIPKGYQTLTAKVVTPGIIDAHATVGLSGILNSPKHDQEQLEKSSPIQPELRAVDAYNGRDPLVKWLRDLGVTTVNTGHAPGTLISGQLMVVKTNVPSITSMKDTLVPTSAVASTLGAKALSKSPGTRSKAIAMLRAELMKAQSRLLKIEEAKDNEEKDKPDANLRLDVLVDILNKKIPLLMNAQRHQDIAAALRLQEEFGFKLILDGAAEAYLLLDEIKAAKVPVIVHPTMGRPFGDLENMTFTLAAQLHKAGIPFAFQSGYEAYVPKTRVVHFEAAMAAAYGLPQEVALAACTIQSARILGLEKKIGSLEKGKHADLALFDGDPLETTTHTTGVIIESQLVSALAK